MASFPAAEVFVAGVAQKTGIDPRVLVAWIDAEGAYAHNGTGGFNYLNIHSSKTPTRGYSGVQLAGYTSGSFPQYRSVQDAITETSYWINNFSNYAGIRTAARQKRSPGVQIAAIAASKWDRDQYGGVGGPRLRSVFSQIFAPAALNDRALPASDAPAIAATAGSGSASDFWSKRGGGFVIGATLGAVLAAAGASVGAAAAAVAGGARAKEGESLLSRAAKTGAKDAAKAGAKDAASTAAKDAAAVGAVAAATGWLQDKAAYAALYVLLGLFAVVLAIVGVLRMLGVSPRAAMRGPAAALGEAA